MATSVLNPVATAPQSRATISPFVMVQLRRQSINRSRLSIVSLDFERLMALVALVFCCNLIVNVIDFGIRLAAKDELDIWKGRWVH